MTDLHNAGNDATFTMHALLMLVVKNSMSESTYRELSFVQRERLELVKAVARVEVFERKRWRPKRRALGFYAAASD